MPEALPDLAPVVAAAGVLVLILGTALTRRLGPTLRLALDFFLAGSLLRLSGDLALQAIAITGLLLVLRVLASRVLRSAT